MNVYTNIEELIGHTPMMHLDRLMRLHHCQANIIAKLESFNPAGSAKDRVALEMILQAEQKHQIKQGSTIIEPTSGNTGIGLAAVCAARGYHALIIMPANMSIERIRLVKAYGAEVMLTPAEQGMQGAVDMAESIHKKMPGSIVAGQFYNPANPDAHFKTTGPEIWRDIDGKVDAFVAGIGTGGTISGVALYLKARNEEIKIIGVEPAESPLLSTGKSGSHGIQGIGANFVPDNYKKELVDEILTVSTEDAYAVGRELARYEGLLAGISSGAAVCAALKLGSRKDYREKNIVVLLPDTGDRYLTTALYEY